MHRCLAIPEVLLNVIYEIRAESGKALGRSGQQTLLNMALTCKAFQNASLDELWRVVYELRKLVECFPRGIWSSSECSFRFQRPPSMADWERVTLYASRIKALIFTWDEELNDRIVNVLTITRPTENLFPSMKDLQIEDDAANISPLGLRIFLSPRLERLQIPLNPSWYARIAAPLPLDWTAFFSALPNICPNLKSLALKQNINELPVSIPDHGCFRLLTNFSAIRICSNTLQALAILPLLREIHAEVSSANGLVFPKGAFPSIERVILQVSKMGQAIQVLSSISSVVVEKLKFLIVADRNPTTEWKCLLLQTQKFSSTLKHINFVETYSYPDSTEPTQLAVDTFHQLQGLKNLTHVFLRTAGFLPVTDNFLLHLSGSLPKLVRLSLSSKSQKRHPPNLPMPTLQGLIPIVKACTNLDFLALAIDARTTNFSLETHPTGGLSAQKIKHIKLPFSPISDPILVAVFLVALFPCLEEIKAQEGPPQELEKWATAQRLLPVYRSLGRWMKPLM